MLWHDVITRRRSWGIYNATVNIKVLYVCENQKRNVTSTDMEALTM